MKRRSFCQATLLASLAASPTMRAFSMAPDNPYRANIGIQLYTLRNELRADLTGALQAVAGAGYRQVEAYGFSQDNRGKGSAGELIRVSKDLGNGMIPMEPIIEWAGKIGVEHCHVEQDQSPHPVRSIQQSMAYLKGMCPRWHHLSLARDSR